MDKEISVICTVGQTQVFKYKKEDLLNTKCDYFESLRESNDEIKEISVHLTSFSFSVIMNYLINGTIIYTKDEKTKTELLNGARYLGALDYIKNFSTDISDLYILSDEDKQLRLEETKIRLFLKSLTDEKELMIEDKKGIRKLNEKEKKMFDDMDKSIRLPLNKDDDILEEKDDDILKEKDDDILEDSTGFKYYAKTENWGCHAYFKDRKCHGRTSRLRKFCNIHKHRYSEKISYRTNCKINYIDPYYVYGESKVIEVRSNLTTLLDSYELGDFDLGKFVVAGGAIFNRMASKLETDLDLFLVTRSEKEAMSEIYRLEKHLKDSIRSVIRSENCFTFLFDHGGKIQVILRLYYNITQIISGFDIDSCCCAYDRKHLYGMPRFLRSLKRGYNIVDPERQSKNYSERLLKYYIRGIGVALPGYDPKRVIPSLMNNRNTKGGMSRLLTTIQKYNHKGEGSSSINSYKNGDYDTIGCIECYQDLIEHLKRIKQYNSLKNNKKVTIPFVYNTTVKKTLKSKCFESEMNGGNLVSSLGPLKFITKDPGTQIGGSFHPISDDWYKSSYEPDFTNSEYSAIWGIEN